MASRPSPVTRTSATVGVSSDGTAASHRLVQRSTPHFLRQRRHADSRARFSSSRRRSLSSFADDHNTFDKAFAARTRSGTSPRSRPSASGCPDQASLGTLLQDARAAVLIGAWWTLLFPAAALIVTTLAVAVVGAAVDHRITPPLPERAIR